MQINGISVQVYERDIDKEVGQQGATLDLHDSSGLKALRRTDPMPDFQKNYRSDASSLRVLDKYAVIRMDNRETENSNLVLKDTYYIFVYAVDYSVQTIR